MSSRSRRAGDLPESVGEASIAGCLAKVRHSLAHAHQLEDSAQRWLAGAADRGETISAVRRDEPNGRYCFVVTDAPKTPEFEWGMALGDFVHDLRSSLDQLTYALADLNRPHRAEDRDTQFPIASDVSEFDSRWYRRAVRHLRQDHKDMIRQLQPCLSPNSYADHPLGWLHRLSNSDKHRGIHVVLVAFDLWSFYGQLPPSVDTVYEEPLMPGSRVFAVKPAAGEDVPESIAVRLPATRPTLALRGGGLLKYLVPNLVRTVEGIISQFKPDFERQDVAKPTPGGGQEVHR